MLASIAFILSLSGLLYLNGLEPVSAGVLGLCVWLISHVIYSLEDENVISGRLPTAWAYLILLGSAALLGRFLIGLWTG